MPCGKCRLVRCVGDFESRRTGTHWQRQCGHFNASEPETPTQLEAQGPSFFSESGPTQRLGRGQLGWWCLPDCALFRASLAGSESGGARATTSLARADHDPAEPSGAYRLRLGGFTLGWDSGRPGSGLKQPRAPPARARNPSLGAAAGSLPAPGSRPPRRRHVCPGLGAPHPADIRLIAQEPSTISGRNGRLGCARTSATPSRRTYLRQALVTANSPLPCRQSCRL